MTQTLIDPVADPVAEIALTGDLARPSRRTVPELGAWPQHQVAVSFDCATSGPQHHRFSGPLLHEVLSDAGPAFDAARHISGIDTIRVDGGYTSWT